MADAGAPPEAIALAVDEIEALQTSLDARRTADRDRKRAFRERQKSENVLGQSGDSPQMSAPPPSLDKEIPPKPPKEIKPIPGVTGTRTHEGVRETPLDQFIGFRKSIKKPMTARAIELATMKLAKLEADGHNPQAVVDQSIFSGWTGLFKLQEDSIRHGKPTHNDRAPDTGGIRNQMLRLVLGTDADASDPRDNRRGAIHGAGQRPE